MNTLHRCGIIQNTKHISNNSNISFIFFISVISFISFISFIFFIFVFFVFCFLFFSFFYEYTLRVLLYPICKFGTRVPDILSQQATARELSGDTADLPDASVLWNVPHSLRREKDSLGTSEIQYGNFIRSDETTHHTNTFRFVTRVFREILALCEGDFCFVLLLLRCFCLLW